MFHGIYGRNSIQNLTVFCHNLLLRTIHKFPYRCILDTFETHSPSGFQELLTRFLLHLNHLKKKDSNIDFAVSLIFHGHIISNEHLFS